MIPMTYLTAPVKLHWLWSRENYIVRNRSQVEEPTNHNARNKAFQLVYSSACDFGNLVFTGSRAMKSQAEQLYILLQTPWNRITLYSTSDYDFDSDSIDSENQAKCVISTRAWAHDNKYHSQKAYLCLTA